LIDSWLTRDGKLILAARGVRTFGYGFLSIVLFIYLHAVGFSDFLSGLVIALILASGALFTFVGGLYADRVGRKKFLILFSILMASSGLIYAFSTNYLLLIIGALVGTLSPTGAEVGPFLSIEQAILPQACTRERRNSLFAIYAMVGQLSASFGALLSGIPSELQSYLHFGIIDSFRPIFGLYSVIALVTAGLYLGLTDYAEIHSRDEKLSTAEKIFQERLSPGSKSIITKLSALFGVDAFAGGFVLQSIISFWFFTRYGVPLSELSVIFFFSGVLSSVTFVVAGRLADKIGAINTMVITHIPSSVFLILMPLGSSFALSLAFFLARQSISSMDIPARQSYTVSIVHPNERTIAAGITNISRNTAQSISPSLSGYLIQFVSLSFPFFIAGSLKIIYDLLLYSNFRKLRIKD
jgi:MFS family permease